MNDCRPSVQTQLDALRAEVARLAAAQRRTRAALAGSLALAAGALLILFAGRAESRISGHNLEAPFRITGRGGVTLFRVGESGVIELNDPSGRLLARTVSRPDRRGLQTFDAGGALTTLLGQQPAAGALNRGVFVYRPNGVLGSMLSHNPVFDASGVVIPGADGQSPVVILAADFGHNRSGLQMTNLALKDEVHLVATPETGLFQLLDSNGDVFFSQPPVP